MMSNNLVKVEDDFQEENEINIYDLINIFLKKKYYNFVSERYKIKASLSAR